MTKIYCNDVSIDAISIDVIEHNQQLDLKNAIHKRKSTFDIADGTRVEINSERFLSAENVHIMAMKYSFKCSQDSTIIIHTGIDGEVWDIDGPHLKEISFSKNDNGTIVADASTQEMGYKVAVAETISCDFGDCTIVSEEKYIMRKISVQAKANEVYTFVKYATIYTTRDKVNNPVDFAIEESSRAKMVGYVALMQEHTEVWDRKWKDSDIIIEGDENAQLALRYSIYHLLAIAPYHTDEVSIPARGLSGQVYKGAVFWDTEMFMLPFFTYTDPKSARNLLRYRYKTLDGARRKAKEYGYRGAFYAWESQDTGDDACSHFNLTDIFTNRPMRTYFRDRQIHVSADVVYGLWQYYKVTNDESILLDGGAEIILECARFYYSYAYYKMDKNRFEILQVVGPDEYHERVDNNAYTNKIVMFTLQIACEVLNILKEKFNKEYFDILEKLDYTNELENIKKMKELLYIPQADDNNSIIEQFDGYYKLEDIKLNELKERITLPNEYLGGTNGLATTTQILKQADVLMMIATFKEEYSEVVKKANWEFYEPRTENGSSLSHCAYAIVAADIGMVDWAYEYFMKTATIDLTNSAKQYLGSLYIGGTHPAANGGAWMTAVFGFAGLSCYNELITLNPRLPQGWKSLKFNMIWQEQKLEICITNELVVITSDNNNNNNNKNCLLNIKGQSVCCEAGQQIKIYIG